MMDQAKIEAFRKKLIDERHQLIKRLQQNNRFGLEESFNQSIGELSSYDHHPADVGTEMFERGKDLAFNDTCERQIEEIEAALKRIETGEYGICQVCKKPIPEERLEVIPWANTCVHHHTHPHLSNRRPVEEEVSQSFQRSQDKRYDRMDVWTDIEEYGTTNDGTIDDHRGWKNIQFNRGYSLANLEEEINEQTD